MKASLSGSSALFFVGFVRLELDHPLGRGYGQAEQEERWCVAVQTF